MASPFYAQALLRYCTVYGDVSFHDMKMRIFLLITISSLLISCANRIEERGLWWDEHLSQMVEEQSNKLALEEFFKLHNVQSTYVENENAFYIMEDSLQKWVIGHSDLWVRVYLDDSDKVNSYRVEPIHTSL
jgi:hypothetical protein